MKSSASNSNIAKQFRDWIGRSMVSADEVTLPAVRRIAAMVDLDPDTFRHGDELPAHWYSMFFTLNARQSQLGHDGHPRKGEFLPPIPLPRRMFVGRSVDFIRPLRIGMEARKISKIASIEEKNGRSGRLVFVTVEHTIECEGQEALLETQRVVYREAPQPRSDASQPRANTAQQKASPAPRNTQWTRTTVIDPVLLFRYSAVTWNGHRIHYDADYARNQEGYPACVINGALTVHLMIDASLQANPGMRLRGLEARLSNALYLGDTLTIAAGPRSSDTEPVIEAWGMDSKGALIASVTLRMYLTEPSHGSA